jgi:hypothetical protein
VFEERVVGIENERPASAEVFPNPSTSGLFTLMTDGLGSSTFVILNGRGEIMIFKAYPCMNPLKFLTYHRTPTASITWL